MIVSWLTTASLGDTSAIRPGHCLPEGTIAFGGSPRQFRKSRNFVSESG
jgi:hypothetical protein